MKVISILDTSICSSNLGDQIIMDAVKKHLHKIFDPALFIQMPTHDIISKSSYDIIKQSNFTIVGGTNLLSSNMDSYNQWKVDLRDSLHISNIILMGVGWWQYQKIPNLYTKILYKRLLSKSYLHSVRDSYTEQQLRAIGFTNVINTSCPTMWNLTPDHCAGITPSKSNSVLVTFTEYNQKQESDVKLARLLDKEYENIYFWTQQPKDYQHMKSMLGDRVIYLNPSLQALDAALSSYPVDYIGTRLHAGVRALQYQRRSLILSVDNRAAEISKDTNLPVVSRDNLGEIGDWIKSTYYTKINIPFDNINEWQNQFAKLEVK